MSKLITHIKRLALTLCLATPIVSWAVTTTGYEDFGDTAGVILWRGTEANFHASTVIDVAEDGSLGEPYAMKADQSATSWQRFASNQAAYASPGKVLVYDTPGTGDGYKYNPNCTFVPLSFGGMWVKTLAINGLPFSILGSGDRKTEFGAAGKSTLFKFDASYTIDRTGTTTFYGDATVDIAQGATFTAQANANYGVAVDSAATLKLKGAGTFAVTTMNVNGTLDLSETTRPAIDGNVALVGTIVLPEGTEVSTVSPFTVCSGTLSCANAYVKIGNAEAVEKHVTVSGGAITGFGDPVYEYTENYPTVVPAGQIFTFIGGETAETATTASGVTVNGTLKTRGYISLTGLTTAKESVLEVVDGTATVTASGTQALSGDITIDAGATMVNATTADALNYGWGVYVNVYGTLDMGSTRWTVGSNAYIHLYENAQIIGEGQGSNGAIDITSANVSVIAHGDSTISANMRVRVEDASIEVEEGKTLTISGLINDGVVYSQPGSIKKKGSGTLVLTTAPTFTKALKLEAGALELGDTAVAADVTVTSSSATVVAAENAVLTGDLTFVAHVPSAANKALIVSDSFTGKVILTGDFGSSNYVSLSGLGDAVTLKDFTGFLNQGWDATNTRITIEGTFTQNNGWSGSADDVTQNAVYIAELLGAGTMTQSGAQKQSYIVGNIANFTGTFNFANSRVKSNNNAVLDKAQTVATLTVANTLTVNGGSLTGDLVANNIVVTVDGTPAVGDVLVPVSGTVSVSGTVTVNGDEVAVECVNGEGVKLAADPNVTITVPAVANATATATIGGESVALDSNGQADVPAGSVVTVTYAANAGYQISGTTEYTIDTATATTFELDESTQTAQIVATITSADGETVTPYTSVATAFTSVDDDETLTLVGTAVTLASNVTVEKSYTLAGDAQGTTVTGAGKIYLTGSAELTLDATLTSVGNQFWFSSKDAKLTFPTEGFSPVVRPYTAGGCQTGTTVNGDGTTTYYQYLFLTLQVGASNVTLAYYDSYDPLVMKQVYEGDEIVFTATPAEGYENVVVTANSEALTPVDGKYTVVVGTANVVIQATASIKQVTLTLPEVGNATAVVTVDSVAQTAPYTFDYGTEVTVTWTADANYEITEGAVENITLTADTEAAAPTVVVTKYTVTVPIVEHTAITVTEGGVTVEGAEDGEGNMVYLVTPASKVVVKYTAVGAYVGSKTKTITSISENTVISGSDVPVPVAAEVEFTNSKSVVSYMLATSLDSLNEGTYKLLTDASRTQRMAFGNWADSVTIDLNGYTLTSTASDCAITAGRTGSATTPKVLNLVDTSAEKGGKLLFTTSPSSTTAAISVGGKYNQVTIGEGVTVDGGAVAMLGENQTLTVNGTVNGGSDFAIVSNGSASKDLTLTVAAGAVVTSDVTAIYLPGTGTATIAGSVTGKTGIEVRSGSLTVVDGATITATGAFSEAKNGSGTTVDGAAVAVSQHTTKNAIDVTVSGGTLTGAKSLYETNIQNGEDTVGITMSVTGGTFTGAVGAADVTGFITGGTFDSDPSAYVASGYAATESAGVWTVAEVQEVPVTPGAQTKPVDTPEAAAEDAKKVVPSVPAAVAEELSDDQETAYKALFETKVVEVTVGETTKYAVEVALKEAVAATIQTEVDDEAEDLAAAAVAAAADATNGGEATVTTKPGLYYVVEAGTEPDAVTPASCTLATSAETKLTVPNKGTKGFYKIRVSVTPVQVPSSND